MKYEILALEGTDGMIPNEGIEYAVKSGRIIVKKNGETVIDDEYKTGPSVKYILDGDELPLKLHNDEQDEEEIKLAEEKFFNFGKKKEDPLSAAKNNAVDSLRGISSDIDEERIKREEMKKKLLAAKSGVAKEYNVANMLPQGMGANAELAEEDLAPDIKVAEASGDYIKTMITSFGKAMKKEWDKVPKNEKKLKELKTRLVNFCDKNHVTPPENGIYGLVAASCDDTIPGDALLESISFDKEIIEYVLNDEQISLEFVNESLDDTIRNMKTKINVSQKIRRLVVSIAILKAKLKILSFDKEKNKLKITDIKKEIIQKEKEKRELTKSSSSEEKSDISKLEKEAQKNAEKEVEKEIKESNLHYEIKKDEEVVKEVALETAAAITVGVVSIAALGVFIKNKVDINRALKYYEKKNNIVPFKKLSVKKTSVNQKSDKGDNYSVKWTNSAEHQEIKYTYSYNKKEVMSVDYVVDRKLTQTFTDGTSFEWYVPMNKELNFAFTDNKFKEHKDYYIFNILYKLHMIDSSNKDWIKDLIAESKGKSVKESSLIDSYCESFMENNDKIRELENDHDNYHGSLINALISENALTLHKINYLLFEAANIEGEIKPIIDKLNSMGYKTKYSSPGHIKLRKKEDKFRDGNYYGKLYSDARIMFDGKYNFPSAPKYWMWKKVDGNDYLDIVPIDYDEKDGTPDEAFNKWKDAYMQSLKNFVDTLKSANSAKDDDNGPKDTHKEDDVKEEIDKKEEVKKESTQEMLDDMINLF